MKETSPANPSIAGCLTMPRKFPNHLSMKLEASWR